MEKKVREKKPKVIGLKQLLNKKYVFLEGLPDKILKSFGKLVKNFIMIVWAQSASGKSNFIYEFLAALMMFGNVLYISLEEGTESTAQTKALRHLDMNEHGGKILFANQEMSFSECVKYLKRKKSPQFIVIDSVQYWDINYVKYKELKALFPGKSFIFISHASGKNTDGKTAEKIRYDAGIKVHIEGFIATVKSRYMEDGISTPYVIWEEGGKKYWGKKYKGIVK